MKNWYNVMNEKGAPEATILIYDVIGGSFFEDGFSAKSFGNTLLELEKEYKIINIRINSPGGSVFEGLGIVNAILNSKAHINTFVDGIAYSMAAIIALSGNKVHIAKNGRLMLHNASIRTAGNAQQLRTEADNLDGYDDSLLLTVATITGLSEADVKEKYFNYKDNYFNATKALENKLVHEVIPVNAEGVDNLIRINEYKDVLAFYKNLDPTSFAAPQLIIPKPKIQNMKYVALAALLAALNENEKATPVQIEAAKKEFKEAKAGFCLLTEAENVALTTAKETAENLVISLNAQISALQVKADAYDALDAEEKTKHKAPPEPSAAEKMEAKMAAMPHNQNADTILA